MHRISTARTSSWRTLLLSFWVLLLPAVGVSPFYYVTAGSSFESDQGLADRPGVEVSTNSSSPSSSTSPAGPDSPATIHGEEAPLERGSKSPATTRNDITLWLVSGSATVFAAPAPAKRLSKKIAFWFSSEDQLTSVTQAIARSEASQYTESGKARECTILGHKPSGLG